MSFDGDNVGKGLKDAIAYEDECMLKEYASGVAGEMSYVDKEAACIGAQVLVCSGDTLIIKCSSLEEVSYIIGKFNNRPNVYVTYSVGIGRSLNEAQCSLAKAKNSGKDRVVYWFDKVSVWSKAKMFIKSPLSYIKNKLFVLVCILQL